MAGQTHGAQSSAVAVTSLLNKLSDPDPDFRFMALNDLSSILSAQKPENFSNDYNLAARTLDGLIKGLDDNVGEVQNLAIKCLDPFIHRCPHSIIPVTLEKLSTMKLKKDGDSSVPSMALRTVVNALPKPDSSTSPSQPCINAYQAVSRVLIPRFVGKTVVPAQTPIRLPPPPENSLIDSSSTPTVETIEVLIDVVDRFGPLMAGAEVSALTEMAIKLLEDDNVNAAVKKRAVAAISLLGPYILDGLLVQLIARIEEQLSQPNVSSNTRRYLLSVVGALARTIPGRFHAHLDSTVPLILSALSEEELRNQLDLVAEGDLGDPNFGDIREAALLTLEALLASCPNEMRPYTDKIIAACLRYLKYDPNYAQDDEDEEMDDEEDDDMLVDEDDFDDDGGFEDEDDDASWKVRRSAAKAIYTLISTRGSGDLLETGVLYRDTAPILIKRFEEREETVRLEVISAMALLIRKTGEGMAPLAAVDEGQLELLTKQPPSRKRRRESSTGGPLVIDANATETRMALSGAGILSPETEQIPLAGPRADLVHVTPSLMKAILKHLKGKLLGSKQAVINLLNDLSNVQRGGLSTYLDQIAPSLLDAIKLAGTSSNSVSLTGVASATPSTLRIASLHLAGSIARSHSSLVLEPYLSRLVSACITAVDDKFFKISSEALKALEELTKAITPQSSSATGQKYKTELLQIFNVLCDKSDANGIDIEVRQRAIYALGVLLSRTSTQEGASLIPSEKRKMALLNILDRLKNETTRSAAAKAVKSIAALSSPAIPLDAAWAEAASLELASQLRKSSRIVRGSSLDTLKYLVKAAGVQGCISTETTNTLAVALHPILNGDEILLIGPATTVLATLSQAHPEVIVTPELINAICTVLTRSVSPAALEGILLLVTCIGKSGTGDPLLQGILSNVGMRGDPSIVGKVIGTLLVSSQSSTVSINDFITEVERSRTTDPQRASLALAVLGEAGFRLGTQNPVEPEYFIKQFGPAPDKLSVAAAVALGRACSGNVPKFLPVILSGIEKSGNTEYLLLNAIKETLHVLSTMKNSAEYARFWDDVWGKLVAAAKTDDNRPACAECMGRLALIEPTSYVNALQVLFYRLL